MSLKTQGTHLYIIDPDATGGPEVLQVGCVTSIDGIEATRDQLEKTCMESEAREYEPGMPTPGQMTFGINFDPADDSHVRIYELWRAGTKFEMALGYSDGTAAPSGIDTAGQFELPTTRSWLVMHDSYFANVPQSLALNALVTANVAVQLSGFPDLIRKA